MTQEMLAEIMRELIKSDINMPISSAQILVWTKGIEAQRAQVEVINSLSEIKNFDVIWWKYDTRKNDIKPATPVKTPTRKSCNYYNPSHNLRWCLANGKKCERCYKMNHLKDVCRSSKSSAVHNMEKETDHEQEIDNEMVTINPIKFNFSCSTIIADQKALLNKVIFTVPYKVYMGTDGNLEHVQSYFQRQK